MASRAVDGNYNTDIGSGSCAGTKDPAGGANWWLVDLGQRMHIKLVVVTNRGDIPACGKRQPYSFLCLTVKHQTNSNSNFTFLQLTWFVRTLHDNGDTQQSNRLLNLFPFSIG